jgi:hypothetical protein
MMLLLCFVAALSAVRFLRPDGIPPPAPASVPVGRVDGFPPGSVTRFQEHGFYLVRLEDGSFLALSMRGARGCLTPWRPDFYLHGKRGHFVEPCSGVVYDRTGQVVSVPAIGGGPQLVAGPDLRGLGRFPVELRGEEVWVHIQNATPGPPAPAVIWSSPTPVTGPDSD